MMDIDTLSRDELRFFTERNQLIHTKQFNREFLENLFALTNRMKAGEYDRNTLRDMVFAVLFYEPSTRTRFSFESAVVRLGGRVITTENAVSFSSASKGETIEDTVRMTDIYADGVIVRTTEDDAPYRAALTSSSPLINAGSGKTQHPTQTLLDMYTLYEHFGRTDRMDIVMAGDLLRSRTIDSLVYVLAQHPSNTLTFVSPEHSRIKQSLREYLQEKEISFIERTSFGDALARCDMCYVTRVQRERFGSEEGYLVEKDRLRLTVPLVRTMKQNAIVLHPLPRVDEIDNGVDLEPQAAYFKQAENGLYTRMALLTMIKEGGLARYLAV